MKYWWKQTMSIWTVGTEQPQHSPFYFTIIFGCNLWYCYERLSLLHVSRLVVLALGWHAQAACLSNHQSLVTAMKRKNLSHWKSSRTGWRCLKVESVSWLKSGAEYNDVFMSHLEIMTNFSENLERKTMLHLTSLQLLQLTFQELQAYRLVLKFTLQWSHYRIVSQT
jgi:hypothetical protein